VTKQRPFDSLGEYIDYYLDVVKSVQPHGPYYVMGWSLGGTVAYEMARAWEAAGEDVAFVGLIDTRIHALQTQNSLGRFGKSLRSVVIILDATIGLWSMVTSGLFLMSLKMAQPTQDGRNGLWTGLKQRWAKFWLRTVLGKSALATTLTEDATLFQAATPTLVETLSVMRANEAIGKEFVPGPYGGKVTLIRASERVRAEPDEPSPTYGWERYAREVEVHYSPGNHVQLFSEPAVHETAAALKNAIARAEQSHKH
jgi:thioesterase domain-containing protein